MIKDMIISGLAAGKVLKIPCYENCDSAAKFSIWLASTVCLLFFLLFLEQMYDKWLEYRKNGEKKKKR